MEHQTSSLFASIITVVSLTWSVQVMHYLQTTYFKLYNPSISQQTAPLHGWQRRSVRGPQSRAESLSRMAAEVKMVLQVTVVVSCTARRLPHGQRAMP